MNNVEKAAERLKALRTEPQVPLPMDPPQDAASPTPAPTLERLQERRHTEDRPPAAATLHHVDLLALKRMGYLPASHDAETRLKDEMRRIKRPLLAHVAGNKAKPPDHAERIMVTSAMPGEGKTFTAMNLALSLALEPDFEVLLVDGDIPKSSLTRILGLEGHPGLMDVLADEKRQPDSVIVRTDVPKLQVVPVGTRHALTAELFGSRRMNEVLGALGGRNRQRLVVFDSSPLLATSEAPLLASHMGQVVMVVAASRTRQQALDASLHSLNESQFVGLVLNMSQLPASENYYDGGYGY